MDLKLIALVFIALVVASGAGYGLGFVLTAGITRKANVTNFPTSLEQSPPTFYRTIALGYKFNWSIGEVIDVQNNKYVYLGHDVSIRLAKWSNGWVDLYYYHGHPQKVSLSPYTLQIYYYSNEYLTGEFLEQ